MREGKPWGGWATFEYRDGKRPYDYPAVESHWVAGLAMGPSLCGKRPGTVCIGVPFNTELADAPMRGACVECWILASRVERERERRRVELPPPVKP